MKRIPLTQGQIALVDDEDFEWLNQWKWYAAWNSGVGSFYAVRHKRNKDGKRRQRYESMHRVIMGAKKGQYVDHLHHDTLDNRKLKLRICTASENQHNRQKSVNNTSGYKGVSWNSGSKKWQAQIGLNGKSRHLGHYSTSEEAARAYNQAAKKYFGEFAKLNKI